MFYFCVALNPLFRIFLLFCVLSYATLLTFDFFWTVFLATCLPQRILFKVLEINAVDSMEYIF